MTSPNGVSPPVSSPDDSCCFCVAACCCPPPSDAPPRPAQPMTNATRTAAVPQRNQREADETAVYMRARGSGGSKSGGPFPRHGSPVPERCGGTKNACPPPDMNRTRAPKGNRAAAPAANCTCVFRIGDTCRQIDQRGLASPFLDRTHPPNCAMATKARMRTTKKPRASKICRRTRRFMTDVRVGSRPVADGTRSHAPAEYSSLLPPHVKIEQTNGLCQPWP